MVEDHKHCMVCGKPTPPDRLLCSPSCEEIFRQQQQKLKKTRMFTMIFFMALFFLIIILSAFRSAAS